MSADWFGGVSVTLMRRGKPVSRRWFSFGSTAFDFIQQETSRSSFDAVLIETTEAAKRSANETPSLFAGQPE